MNKVLIAFSTLLATLVPALPAHSAPAIAILNPSGYGPAEISVKPDADSTYHLVAWVADTPATPSVRFELGGQTFEAARVGTTDTWEAHYDGSVSDGDHTLTAKLLSAGTTVAQAEAAVTVNDDDVPVPLASETAEIAYPVNGGPLGFYSVSGAAPTAIIDATTSLDATTAYAYFTTSRPGTAPVWTSCGSSAVPSSTQVRMVCTLPAGVSSGAVRAVAVSTNATPAGSPSPLFDDSGDAHRVFPYTQDPEILSLTPSSASVAIGSCTTIVARVLDGSARPVAGANIDVHASGPDGALQFGSGAGIGQFRAPEGGHDVEPGVACDPEAAATDQGRHDGTKHAESVSGTDASGEWVFALRSGAGGGTHVSAWVDEDGSDTQEVAEAAAGAQLGWGQAPPAPLRELFIDPVDGTGTRTLCERVELVAREGGSGKAFTNVDVHITGPSATVSFCDPGGGNVSGPPNAGGHDEFGEHPGSVKHIEGNTGASGSFVFGIRSITEGTTEVEAWLDDVEDDVLLAEPSVTASMTWKPIPLRAISLKASPSKVAAGRRVRLSGELGGDFSCISRKKVKLQAKRVSGGSFKTIAAKRTQSDGDYGFKVKMRRSKKFRTVAPATPSCSKAKSRAVTVRVKR